MVMEIGGIPWNMTNYGKCKKKRKMITERVGEPIRRGLFSRSVLIGVLLQYGRSLWGFWQGGGGEFSACKDYHSQWD